jgi:hypothetical protein
VCLEAWENAEKKGTLVRSAKGASAASRERAARRAIRAFLAELALLVQPAIAESEALKVRLVN